MAKLRDPLNGLTHCIACGLSIIGLIILIVFASIWGNAYHIVSFTIFGTALVLLYLFSTLYHWLNIGEKGVSVFRKFDHIMIYVLIAASYTPICLVPLRGAWGWSIFGVVWGIAVLGIILSSVWIKAPRFLTTALYLLMGWIVIIALYPLVMTFNEAGLLYSLWWLVAGGIFYTIGGIIYAFKIPKKSFHGWGFHEIFHIFIILGSVCHYWFILHYVLMFQ